MTRLQGDTREGGGRPAMKEGNGPTGCRGRRKQNRVAYFSMASGRTQRHSSGKGKERQRKRLCRGAYEMARGGVRGRKGSLHGKSQQYAARWGRRERTGRVVDRSSGRNSLRTQNQGKKKQCTNAGITYSLGQRVRVKNADASRKGGEKEPVKKKKTPLLGVLLFQEGQKGSDS